MKTRNNVMIIDTETVGTWGQPLVHDVGYVIIDRKFNILKKARFLVEELHIQAPWILASSEFYLKYEKDYKTARKHETIMKWKDITKAIQKDMREYKVTTISTYNLAFDYRAIKYTEEMFKSNILSKILDQKSKSLLCLFNLACETILQGEAYRNYAEQNNFFTEKGNIKTSAECAYSYITNNPEYKESHTALADAEDEKEILEYIIRNVKGRKDMQYGLHYNSWKKVQ